MNFQQYPRKINKKYKFPKIQNSNKHNNNYIKNQSIDIDNELDTNNENENQKMKEYLNIRFYKSDDMEEDNEEDDVSLILSHYTNSTRFEAPEFKYLRSLKVCICTFFSMSFGLYVF